MVDVIIADSSLLCNDKSVIFFEELINGFEISKRKLEESIKRSVVFREIY